MSEPRLIAIVTGTRAEYGLLAPVIRAVRERDGLTLRLIATGMHLVRGTERYITEDGFTIDARVPMQIKDQLGRAADVRALGRGVTGLGEDFYVHRPDFVVVLGDRIEAFAAAAAAAVGGARVAHIHGGDRAEGIADESIRHAISKMAHVHFAATHQSRMRLIKMGEHESHVFNTGSPAIDTLEHIEPAEDAPQVIVMQHPVGEDDEDERRWMTQTLEATAGMERLVMAPNADAGSEGVREALRRAGVEPVEHMQRDRFLSLLMGARVIVGNSSAGLIEASALRTPCVNVGPRQAGREKPTSVVDCEYGLENVRAAITTAGQLNLAGLRHPYGDGTAGLKIAEQLATLDLKDVPLRKHNAY